MRTQRDFAHEMAELLRKFGKPEDKLNTHIDTSVVNGALLDDPQEFRFRMPYSSDRPQIAVEGTWHFKG